MMPMMKERPDFHMGRSWPEIARELHIIHLLHTPCTGLLTWNPEHDTDAWQHRNGLRRHGKVWSERRDLVAFAEREHIIPYVMGNELAMVVMTFSDQPVVVRDATLRVLLALRGCRRMPMPDMALMEKRFWGTPDPWQDCWDSRLYIMEHSR